MMKYMILAKNTQSAVDGARHLGIPLQCVNVIGSPAQLRCIAPGSTIYLNTGAQEHPKYNEFWQIFQLRNIKTAPLTALVGKLLTEGKLCIKKS